MVNRRGVVIHPHELDEKWLDTMAALNLNVLGLHPVGGAKANETLENLLQSRERLQPLLELARRMGITVEYEMHSLSWLLPRALYNDHPEWFRMDENGQRIADFNICPSQEDALNFLTLRAEVLAGQLPTEDHLYYFWIDDVSGYRCHCPKCAHLTASDQQMRMVNAIQRGVRRRDPLGKTAYLAYLDAIRTPQHVRPEDGVFLEFAPIRRKTDVPICDPDCPENRRQIADLENLLSFFGRKDAKVLEYWTDNSMFSKWTYPPRPFTLNHEVMRQDVRYYESLGFDSITAFACYLGEDYRKLHGCPDLSGYKSAFEESCFAGFR